MPALVALLLVLALAAPAAAKRRDVGSVPAGHTLVVIGQPGVDKSDALAAATGTEPAGAMWYLGVYEEAAAIDAVLADIRRAVEAHPGLVVNLGLSFGSVSTPSPPHTAAIAAGAHDASLARIAAGLRELPTVVYVRPGYEFDLLGGQYGPPELYRAAYRRVVDRLRAAGLRNAAYVWHSAGAFWRATDPSLFAAGSGSVATALREAAPGLDPQPIAAFFPGRRYVDAFGISYWQDSCCVGRSGEAARGVYQERTRELLGQARAMGLPLHVSESTPVYVGADSGAESVDWLDRTFALIEEFDIRMLSLIAIDWQEGGFFAAPFWNGYWPDARVHAYDDTRARYVAEMSEPRYVGRSRDLPRQLGLRKRR